MKERVIVKALEGIWRELPKEWDLLQNGHLTTANA
jgi:hypothetical protein